MTRITQSQVKIAEAIESEGPLTAAQIANTFGARVSNIRRAADYMVDNGHLTFWDGRYSLTKLGRDDVLLSHAAITLKRTRRNEAQKPAETAPKADLFTVTHIGADEIQWTQPSATGTVEPKADPISDEGFFTEFLDDIFPIVTEAVMLDIAGHNITLSVDDAQELRDALNKFFEGE
jgi:hypothetical protein